MAFQAKQYHDIAKKHNSIFLEEKSTIVNTYTPVWWECENGHQTKKTYKSFRENKGRCKECFLESTRYTQQDYKNIGLIKNVKFLDGDTSSEQNKVSWQCLDCGFIWDTTLATLKTSKHGCPNCATNNNRISKEEYVNFAETIGFEYISGYNGSVKTRVSWKCDKGHTFTMSFTKLKNGKNCNICSGKYERTINDYLQAGEKYGLKLVGKPHKKATQKTDWECIECGSILHHSLSNLKSKNSKRCRTCAFNNARISEEQYIKTGKEVNLIYKSGYTGSVSDLVLWECSNCGFEIEARYMDVNYYNAIPCRNCNNALYGFTSKPQLEIFEILKPVYNVNLENRIKPYFIDIALLDHQIAIEYDGWYWHKDRLDNDKERDMYLKSLGWKVLRIKGGKQIPDKPVLLAKIEELINKKKKFYSEIVLDEWRNNINEY